jgi:hypothetical protein
MGIMPCAVRSLKKLLGVDYGLTASAPSIKIIDQLPHPLPDVPGSMHFRHVFGLLSPNPRWGS